MKITEVKIYPVKKGDTLKAFAAITFDEAFVVKGLKVIEGKKGLFVAMPSTEGRKKGEYFDSVYPITKELRESINDAVIEEYEALDEDDDDDFDEPKKKAKKRR